MRKLLMKLISAALSITTAISAIGSTGLAGTVLAADTYEVECKYFPYHYDFSGSGLSSIYGDIPNLKIDGKIGYCVDSLANSGSAGNVSTFEHALDYTLNSKISLALAYGYTGTTKYGYSADVEQLATQVIVWNICDGWYDTANETTALNIFTAGMWDIGSDVKNAYNAIKSQMKAHSATKPSFDGTTQKMSYSNGKFTLTLTDSNGVLNNFNWSAAVASYNYLSVTSQTASSITFTSTKEFSNLVLQVKRSNSKYTEVYGERLRHKTGNNMQDCIHAVSSEQNRTTLTLSADNPTGDITINKILSQDGKNINPGNSEYMSLINDLTFRVYTSLSDAQSNSGNNIVYFTGNAGHYTYNTASQKAGIINLKLNGGGFADLLSLPPKQYYIREINSRSGWTSNAASDIVGVSVSAGENGSDNKVTFTNTRDKGGFRIIKELLENGKEYDGDDIADVLGNLYFTVHSSVPTTNDNMLNFGRSGESSFTYTTETSSSTTNIVLDDTGNASVLNLPTGTYYVVEHKLVEDEWIAVQTTKQVVVANGDNPATKSVIFINEKATPQTGGVTVQKEITLNGEAYNPTNKSAVIGALSFQIARNSDMSDIVHFTGKAGAYTYAESGGVTELKLNTLTAKFNASDLPAGKYWIKELGSGEGYEIEGGNPQEFTITEDQTSDVNVIVENSVITGNGKIIKTFINSSHHLSAAEKAELYKQIYFTTQHDGQYIIATTTESGKYTFSQYTSNALLATHLAPNSNGEVEISDLPVGEYIVTEYCSASGYEPTTPSTQTVTVEKDKTAEVKFVNSYRMPEVETLATINGEKASFTSQNATIVIDDIITYKDLIAGEQYTIKGVVYDKSTKQPFLISGKQVTAEKTFTADSANGTVAVKFSIPASAITEKTSLVVFEQLMYNGDVLTSHEDIDDDGQTVTIHVPEIGTVATANTEKDVFAAEGVITITDKISYHDLIQNSRFVAGGDKAYRLEGVLYDKSTNAPFIVNGAQVKSTKVFTTETEDGSVEVSFTFDASAITKNTELVVFESLYFNGVEIANEKNINNTDQTITVHVPDIGTTATVSNEKDTFAALGEITIKDTISYTDLIVGKQYTVNGVLIDKSTNKPFLVNGAQVTSTATFTAQIANGSVDVYFTFDASGITAKTNLVVFEDLYYNDVELAVHSDINDASQTVTVHTPKIGTSATVNDEQEIYSADGKITLKDVVSFNDLIAGKQYTIKGIIYDKSTNQPLLVGGKEVTAEKKFIATTADGNTTVEFTFDVSAIEKNTSLVVFEEIYYTDTKLTEHKDINDKGQTIIVHSPTVGTVATVNDEHDTFTANKTITIKDVVSYTDLIVGKQYTIRGTLINKKTGEAWKNADGSDLTAGTTFTATTASGTANVMFVIDVSSISENIDIVVFEELYSERNVKIAEHKDIEDKGQTITVHNPKIGTTATVGEDEKDDFAVGFVTITDVVEYSDLVLGKEYTVKGILMDKATNQPLLTDGKEITAETSFTAEKTDGTVEVIFTFDASPIIENKNVVAFEHLYLGTLELTAHTDIEDEGQTITLHKPNAETTAIIGEDKEIFSAFGEIILTDTVEYTDLIIGKTYTVKGKLYDKATNAPFIMDGKEVIAETTFIAETADGNITVEFNFDASSITETTDLVVFEHIYYDDIEIVVHADIDDASQTIKVRTPHITTVATVSDETITDEKEAFADGIITIKDVVSYDALIIGKEYTVKGILMNKATGEAWIDNTGNPIAGQTTFVAETNEGSVEVTFTFSAEGIDENTDLVVYQKLYNVGIEICNHEDIADEGQTVKLRTPKIGTKAQTDDGKKETFAVGEITIVDTVEYHDLIIGKEYKVQGVLMNKATNKPLLIDGKEVAAETVFIAESTDGEVTLTFTFVADGITTRTTVVVFETLCHDDIEIAVHADINDEDQSVLFHKPSIHTTALINGEKEIFAPKHVRIVDTVTYDDLVIGEEYVIKGTLMDKVSNSPLLINGNPVLAETKFTAETTSGTIDVPFEFEIDPKQITESTEYVIFQKLYLSGAEADGEEIATHENIEDMGQTVTIKPNPPEEIPNTGVGVNITLVVGCLIALAGAVIVFMLKKREER